MQTMTAPPKPSPVTAAEIRQILADGQRLIASRQLQAAAVMLWATFEAAVRLSLTDLGQRTDDPIGISGSPYGLCAQAVSYGIIDPEDRDVLLRLLPIAHGDAEGVDVRLLQELSRFTERTLEEIEQQ